MQMAVLGMSILALTRLRMVVWKCYSGHEGMVVLGTMKLALVLPTLGIWKYYSGHVRMAVLGVGRTCSNAAMNGQLEVLRWVHANGCPWDAATPAYAAENGHLEVLQWAVTNGCDWDREICCDFAMLRGRHHVCAWIRGEPVG